MNSEKLSKELLDYAATGYEGHLVRVDPNTLREAAQVVKEYDKAVGACLWMHDDKTLGLQPPASITTDGVLALKKQRDEMAAKLEFLKSKGLTVGLMKTSDKSDPYLVYVIEPNSELCDLKSARKVIDAEIECDKLRAELDKLKMESSVAT